MKLKFLFLSILFLTLISIETSYAQKHPASPFLEVGYLIPTNNTYAFRFRAVISKPVSSNFNIGVGFGTENYKSTDNTFIKFNYNTFPVFVDLRYFISKSDKSAFIFSNVGYSLKLAPSFENGLLAAGGVGYRFNIGKNTLMLSTGYNYQKLSASNQSINTVPIQAAIIF